MGSCKKKYIIKVDPFLSKGPKGDKGDPGEGVELLLPLSTDDVDYRGQVLTDVIDDLLYLDLVINSFAASPSIFEKGQVLTALAVNWSYNKPIESQSISGIGVTPPTLAVGDRNVNLVLDNVAINTTITLTADDDTGDSIPAKTRQLTINFYNKIHYGKAVIPGAFNNTFILSLEGFLQSNRNRTFNLTTGLNEYIWFILPVSYGTPSFTTNGFNGGFQLETVISHTNASGHTEDYAIYRSVNHNLGLTYVGVT